VRTPAACGVHCLGRADDETHVDATCAQLAPRALGGGVLEADEQDAPRIS
jgi:hypothetical protein